jgi:murein DD-endopeptidase MepM/ murein hydrolase activator NlpD
VHDGEPDHEGRRSQLALLPYALGQAGRVREGADAVAGNHVVLATAGARFVVLAHLRRGSLCVAPGDTVAAGHPLAECGNSGNSTQPHLHLQVMDDTDPGLARGVPLAFDRFRESAGGGAHPRVRASAVPSNGAIVEPWP